MASGEELARLRELERQSYEYGLPEQEDMSIFGKAVDLFTPFRRPIYREREETFTDPYFDERGELVVDRSVEPGLYGEPEFGLGYMPVVQGAMTAGESLAGLVTDPEARSRALEMAQAAPGAINRQMETSFQAAMRGEPELFDPEMGQAVSATDALLMTPALLGAGRVVSDVPRFGFGIFGSGKGKSGQQAEDTVEMLEEAGLDPAEGWDRQAGSNTYKAYRSSLDNKVRYEIPMTNVSFKQAFRETEDPDVELGKLLDPDTRTEQRLLAMQGMRIRKNKFDDGERLTVPGRFDLNEKELNKFGFTKYDYMAGRDGLQKFPAPALEQIIDFPELFNEYPQLRNIKVTPTPPLALFVKGAYNPETKTIQLASVPNTPEGRKEMMSTLMHEVQHAVQDIEGLYGGANTGMFTPTGFSNRKTENSQSLKAVEENIEDALDDLVITTDANPKPTMFSTVLDSERLGEALQGAPEAEMRRVRYLTRQYLRERAEEAEVEAKGGESKAQLARRELSDNIERRKAQLRERNRPQNEIDAVDNEYRSQAFRYSGSDRTMLQLNDALKKAEVKNHEQFAEKIAGAFNGQIEELRPLLREKQAIEDIESQAHEMYAGNPGEVEARNVQRRFEGIEEGEYVRGPSGEMARFPETLSGEELQRAFPEDTQQMVLPESGLVYSMREGRKSEPSFSIDDPDNPQMELPGMRPPEVLPEDPAANLLAKRDNLRGSLLQDDFPNPRARYAKERQLRKLEREIKQLRASVGYPTDRDYREGGEVKKMDSKRPGIGQLVYDRYINPVQGFRRGGPAQGRRGFNVEAEPLNPYAAMIAARDAKDAATPARGSTPGAIKKGPQPTIGFATARMPPEQEAAMRAATGNYAVGDALRAEGFLPTRGPEAVLPAQTTVSTPLASELMMQPSPVPEDIVSRGTVGPVAPLPEPEPIMGPMSAPPPGGPSAPPPRAGVESAITLTQPVGPITAAPANIAEAGPSGGGAPAMDLYVQPDGSVMPGAAQPMVQPMTDGEGVPVDLGDRIMAGEFREPVQELVDQGVIESPQTAGEQLAQTGTGGDFGLEPIAPGQNLQDFSYDNFDPNEVSYVRALFTQMGLDPDQNEIALQETLQNQFGTGAQVSGETLQLTFGNSDNSLLDAIGVVGTYGEFLDSQAQTAPGSGTGTTGDPVVGGTDLNVQPGGEILPGADDQGPLEPVGTGQTAGEQLAEETGGDFGLDEVKLGQNVQDFSYDNFDPNEIGYIRSLLNQMGIDPDQNEIVLQELLQNQFGTGAQVSGETLQLTFGNSDNSILDAMGVVGTYSDYLNSMNQPPPADPAPADPGTGTGTGDQLPGEDLAGQDPAPADPYPGLITEGIVDGQFGYYRYDPDTMTDSSQAEFVPLSFEEYMGIFAPGQENFGKLRGPDGYEQLPMEFYQSEQFSNFLRQHAEEELRRQTDPNYTPPMSTMEYNMTSDGKYGFSGNDPLGGAYEAWLATQGGETTPVDPAPVDPAPVDPAPVDPAPVDPAPPYEPPPVSEDPPINQDPIFDPDPMPEAPEPTPVEYLSGVTPGFDVQTYIDQATRPIDRSAYTQGIEYGRNLMPGDPDEAGGYRIPVYTPTPRATYPGLTFRRQANRATTASQNIQAAQMAGAAIGGGGNYGGIPLNFDPNNWQGTSASLPPGVGGAEADQQITCPDGYVLSMENGNYYCKNVQQTGGGMSQAMRGPDRVDPIYVSVATAMNKGGEVMPAGIGSFFPEELVEQMGPGLVSSRERTYTYPSGVTVEETQSTGRFMFGDR